MAEFPYTPNPPNVAKFFDHLLEAGVPRKVNQGYLNSVGFTSSNDRYVPGVLTFLGFIEGGAPTAVWKAYKDKSKAGAILATQLRSAYSDLFTTYPDAFRKDDEALHNYFASKTGLAKKTVDRVVRTFRILCDKADFEAAQSEAKSASGGPAAKNTKSDKAVLPELPPAPAVAINIQLHLPPTDDAEVYEKLFKAMKKHLFS